MTPNDNSRNGAGGQLGFEAELFKAADKLRRKMEPSDFKHFALGLIFLKYITDAFAAPLLPAGYRGKVKLMEDVVINFAIKATLLEPPEAL